MEGVGNLEMAMPLSTVEVAYSIFQHASANLDSTPPQKLELVLKPIFSYISHHL